MLKGNYSLESISMFWAGLLEGLVVLPLTNSMLPDKTITDISDVDMVFDCSEGLYTVTCKNEANKKINNLIKNNHPGIVILSSGTTGVPKAILHDAEKLLRKYLSSKRGYVTLATMLFDHIAGIDTMFYTLCSGGNLIILDSRTPQKMVELSITNKVEVLPTSPSMLQLMLLDGRFNHDSMPDLKIITFGSESITDTLKERILDRFAPNVTVIQKYGITEIGNPATITRENDPSYFKFKEGLIEYKVLDGVLFLRSPSSMLGYLFYDHVEAFDGWFNTKDKVERDGEWIKILGRVTDIINVGGQKVYPAEVESILQKMDNVKDVTVYGISNPILGYVVAAKVILNQTESLPSFKKRMREFCRDKLESYKIPVSVIITNDLEISQRFKKVRAGTHDNPLL